MIWPNEEDRNTLGLAAHYLRKLPSVVETLKIEQTATPPAQSDVVKGANTREWHAGIEWLKDYIRGWLKPGELQLRAGEMSAQELRTVKAVLTAILSREPLPGEQKIDEWVAALSPHSEKDEPTCKQDLQVDREDLGCFLDSKFGLIDDPWKVADGILERYTVAPKVGPQQESER